MNRTIHIVCACGLFLVAMSAFGQSNSGAISGIVKDLSLRRRGGRYGSRRRTPRPAWSTKRPAGRMNCVTLANLPAGSYDVW